MDLLTTIEIEAIKLSLKISFWALLWSLPLALGTAWILARHHFPGKFIFDGIIHLPLVLPPVVIGYVLLVLMGKRGLIGSFLYEELGISLSFSWRGAAIAAGIMAFPLIVRAIRLSLETVDQNLEAAARTLGARPITVFMTITLPLITPGIIAGAILGFARCLGEFGATITFVSNIPGLHFQKGNVLATKIAGKNALVLFVFWPIILAQNYLARILAKCFCFICIVAKTQ